MPNNNTKPIQMSELAKRAYAVGSTHLVNRRRPFPVTLESPSPSQPLIVATRSGYITTDSLCAIHYHKKLRRWIVTMLHSGIAVGDCPTRTVALTLLGLCYLDHYLSEIARCETYTAAKQHYHESCSDPSRRRSVNTAINRVKACVDGKLDSLF